MPAQHLLCHQHSVSLLYKLQNLVFTYLWFASYRVDFLVFKHTLKYAYHHDHE